MFSIKLETSVSTLHAGAHAYHSKINEWSSTNFNLFSRKSFEAGPFFPLFFPFEIERGILQFANNYTL